MPIDRDDGRHWCDPGSETPGEDGTWTCTCKVVWRRYENGVWGRPELESPPVPPQVPASAGDPSSEPSEGDEH